MRCLYRIFCIWLPFKQPPLYDFVVALGLCVIWLKLPFIVLVFAVAFLGRNER